MPGFNSKFFHKGIDNQSRSNLSVDYRRAESRVIRSWSPEEKKSLLQWAIDVKAKFNAYISEIESACSEGEAQSSVKD